MKRQLDKALDHLIALHKIEETKIPRPKLGKAVGLGIFLFGVMLLLFGAIRENPYIALTFDAAWGNEDTETILQILQRQNVQATFFMTGGWVSAYPEDVKAIFVAGHDLANHSETHKNMSCLSDTEKKEELMTVHKKVKDLTGVDMFLFRPPYGDYDNAVVTTAKSCGYYTIAWNIDSLDWKDYGTTSIIETVCENKHLGCGSIILCHNGARYTAEALEEMIEKLKEKGYSFVPVSELIYRDNYHMDHEGRQIPDTAN